MRVRYARECKVCGEQKMLLVWSSMIDSPSGKVRMSSESPPHPPLRPPSPLCQLSRPNIESPTLKHFSCALLDLILTGSYIFSILLGSFSCIILMCGLSLAKQCTIIIRKPSSVIHITVSQRRVSLNSLQFHADYRT